MLLTDLLDFIFPPTCAACGQRLARGERSVCRQCLRSLHRVPYLSGGRHGDIERLFWGQVPVGRAASLFYYDSEAVRSLLHSLKYHNNTQVGEDMGRLLAESLTPHRFFDGISALVPVPLHWHRRLRRGYNQSDYIARGLHLATGIPLRRDAVRRVKDNPTQTNLNPAQRRANVENIFRLTDRGAEALRGRHVLLIDDTLTTGATLLSCAREIARAASLVSVCTLAYAGELVRLDHAPDPAAAPTATASQP